MDRGGQRCPGQPKDAHTHVDTSTHMCSHACKAEPAVRVSGPEFHAHASVVQYYLAPNLAGILGIGACPGGKGHLQPLTRPMDMLIPSCPIPHPTPRTPHPRRLTRGPGSSRTKARASSLAAVLWSWWGPPNKRSRFPDPAAVYTPVPRLLSCAPLLLCRIPLLRPCSTLGKGY